MFRGSGCSRPRPASGGKPLSDGRETAADYPRGMSDEPVGMEDQDAWALADLDSAISVMSATVGAAFGPLGAILGAGVGSYAKFAIRRFLELQTRIDGAGLEEQEIIERLDENETLAQMIAEVVRGTVESDLEAKRRLLADATIRALQDDAERNVFVQAAAAINTVDVRVLAIIGDPPPERAAPNDPTQRRPEGTVYPDELVERWPASSNSRLHPSLASSRQD